MANWAELDARWHQEAEQVLSGMKEWRLAHPRATLREIETALDEQLGALRARLLGDLALVSRAADLRDEAAGELPACPDCGTALAPRGAHERTVLVHGGQALELRRDYAVCPACGAGLFPPG